MYPAARKRHLRRIYYLHGIYPTNVALFSPGYRSETAAVRYLMP
jgi:hypothetical protein